MEFKDRLRMLRTEKGLTITQLAVAFEKSEGAVRMWETGRAKPDVDTLIKLSIFFDVTTDFLLGKCEAKHPENEIYVSRLGLTDEAIINVRAFAWPIDDVVKGTRLDVLNKIIPLIEFYSLLGYLGVLTDPSVDNRPDIELEKPQQGRVPFRSDFKSWNEYLLTQTLVGIVEKLKGGASNAPQSNT